MACEGSRLLPPAPSLSALPAECELGVWRRAARQFQTAGRRSMRSLCRYTMCTRFYEAALPVRLGPAAHPFGACCLAVWACWRNGRSCGRVWRELLRCFQGSSWPRRRPLPGFSASLVRAGGTHERAWRLGSLVVAVLWTAIPRVPAQGFVRFNNNSTVLPICRDACAGELRFPAHPPTQR